MKKPLIVYFSHSGENYWKGSTRWLEKGNTKKAAEILARLTKMFEKCPAGRAGTADEIAHAAELLMSDKGAFITGATLLADGGATASYYYGPLQPELN